MAPDGTLIACPECGSREVRRVQHIRILLAIAAAIVVALAFDQDLVASIALVAALAVVLLPDVVCARCHYRWNPRRERPEPPPPNPADTVEHACAKCGSLEVYDVGYPIIGPRCDECGAALRAHSV